MPATPPNKQPCMECLYAKASRLRLKKDTYKVGTPEWEQANSQLLATTAKIASAQMKK